MDQGNFHSPAIEHAHMRQVSNSHQFYFTQITASKIQINCQTIATSAWMPLQYGRLFAWNVEIFDRYWRIGLLSIWRSCLVTLNRFFRWHRKVNLFYTDQQSVLSYTTWPYKPARPFNLQTWVNSRNFDHSLFTVEPNIMLGPRNLQSTSETKWRQYTI